MASAEANLTVTELNFLNDGINAIIVFGESLTFQSKELFDTYGFIVDAKQVFLFVTHVRRRIKLGINQLMLEFSERQIKRALAKSFEWHSIQLKRIFDKEITRIYDAVNQNEDNLECWNGYKVPILELGFEVVHQLKGAALNESGTLAIKLEELRKNISDKEGQLSADLAQQHTTMLAKRSSVTTYVSLNFETSQMSFRASVFCFRSGAIKIRSTMKSILGFFELPPLYDRRR